MDQQLIDYLKAGQSYWAVYPTNIKARAALDGFRFSTHAKHFDFVLERMAVLPKSTNQMVVPTFGRFVSIDSDPEIIRGSNAIVYIPLPLPHHQNSDRWREAQLIMERHRVKS